jgi:hypothetical protein
MSDTTENVTEKDENNGVQTMSLQDALNFSQGEKPEIQAVEEVEETIIEDKVEVVEDKKEVIDDAKEEVVVVDETEKVVEKVEVSPKVEKEDVKDPYEGIDEEDRDYYDFKKRNKGTTRKDFEDSLIDYTSFDKKELLRRSLREKYGFENETDEQLNDYIEEELGIPMDSDESDMTVTERVRLRKETDGYIKDKKDQHSKWSESKTDEKGIVAPKEQLEMVTLENGNKMPKKEYDQILESRNNYVKSNEEALNRVKDTSVKITVSENGNERELEYNYAFDKEDKHRMLSISSDVVANFNKTYTTDKGYDHEGINIDQAWSDKQLRNKMLSSMLQAARAEGFEESMKDQGNINLGSNKRLQPQDTKGVKYVPLSELLNR